MFNIFRTLNKGEDAMVLVEGSPGIGKTTFCLKISHDWANGTIPNESSFPLFELLLLLKCRDIHGDVMDAIVDQLLPEDIDQNATKNVVHYIKDIHNQERILIILDGLDELPKTAESSVDKLLHRRILPFCYILATSRQEKGIEVRQNVDFDVLLQIKGFTETDSYDYIRKHFRHLGQDYEPKGRRLIEAIQDNSYLHELPSNPLNLLLLCVVFEDYEGNLPSCRTDLYQIIVACLLRRYCAKHNLEAPDGDKAIRRHFENSLLVLGELAWRCLKEGRFSFREEELVEFESTHESLAARKLGLVFKEGSLRKINPQHEYFFFHKTFQEYLAAFYLAHMLLKQMVDFSELNFDEDLVERDRQVFVFMSGILNGEAGVLFEQIGKKLKDENWDWWKCYEEKATFFQECFLESRNYEQVAMALCSFIPFPQTITIDLAEEQVTTDWFIILNACTRFSQVQLPVHLAIRNLCDYILADVNNDLLADFVAFNTRLQTLSFSVTYMTKEITTLVCRVLRVDSTAYSFTLEVTCSNISSVEFVAISDSLAANKTLTTVTFQLPCKILEDYVAILDKGLSADTPLTSVVLKTFGPWMETKAELFRKILLNRSLTSLSLTVVEDMQDSLATSVSEGLITNPSLKSLALIVCGKLSYTSLNLLKEGFLGNKSLESLQLKVFGELPTNWANICGTLQSAIKSTTSLTVYPNVTGMVGNSQVAFLCPVLKENISASKLHSVTVNIWGELDCSGATDLCKLLIASSVSCVNLNMNGRITDSVADCLFKHFNKLDTLSYLSIDIQGEVMGDGKKTLQRLSCNQTYLFAFNVHSFNSGNMICREVCLSTNDSSPITPVFAKVKDGCVTKLSVSINNPGSISEDWKCNLFEGLAKNECVTTLNLVFNNIYPLENIDALGDGLGKNTSLTTLSLTVNNYSEMSREDLTGGLGDGLGKNTSLTTLSLTVNNYSEMSREDLTGGLGDGLGKNTSLTTLSLTVNNYSEMIGDLTGGLGDGLGKNTSLTTLSLTVNNYSEMIGDLTGGLGDGLGKNTSLTTLSLTVNNYSEMIGDLTGGLGDGLGKNTSLTTLSLTVNNYSEMIGDLTGGLGDGLGKNTSLTTLSLTVNNYSEMSREEWTLGLGDGLGKNTSLTTLSLTVNNYSEMSGEDLTGGLGDGLGKNTSLTTLSLTVNNYNEMIGDLTLGLGDGLGKNTSLTAISLEVNIFGEGKKSVKVF
ncbi:NACHT, LRR and PYD domains-containing protein 2-like [Pocillopora verrucosa]|uniref:NACHT, LRR and PYD domains-containing protein 2-like n=1 Tax=Pocillopora verrucosa TaxID=203993 RepID=UPI003342016A